MSSVCLHGSCLSACQSSLHVEDPHGPAIMTSVLHDELLLHRSAHVLCSLSPVTAMGV